MAELKAKLAEMQEAKQKFVSQHATKTEGELPLGGPTPHVDDSSVLSAKHVIIGHKLGSGFFGDVYQGEWRGIAVALKFLSIDGAEELARESATLDALDHPNVMRLYGVVRCAKQDVPEHWPASLSPPCIVCELAAGGTRCNTSWLPPTRVCALGGASQAAWLLHHPPPQATSWSFQAAHSSAF